MKNYFICDNIAGFEYTLYIPLWQVDLNRYLGVHI